MPDLVTLSTPISNVLLGWFAETTAVASVLAAAAALVARARRLAPGPAARHALWLMVMVKLVMPPMVHWPWSVPSPLAATPAGIEPAPEKPTVASRDTLIVEPEGVEVVRAAEPPALESRPAGEPGPGTGLATWALPRNFGAWIVAAWLAGSVALAVGQARRVFRFRRLLVDSTRAPGWLLDEANRVGERLGVRVPAILVVPRLGTPLLWCLGRPVLLVPDSLLKSLEADRWRAIVAHELAHLRRGDHWVRRLELVAGLAWWWNPLYWLARRRLDFEAELACDAWAVWALPEDRVSYAESLIRICTTLSQARSPAPALGVVGTGRSFERRLTMILRDRVERRPSAPSLLAATLLATLALPSWTLAEPAQSEGPKDAAPAPFTVIGPFVRMIEIVTNDSDDDDETTEQAKVEQEQLAAKKAAEAKAKAALEKSRAKREVKVRAMEESFGADSDFVKRMEALGKEMEAKFGPDSDFAKKMEALGKEIEKKVEPGVDLGKEIELRFGPGSDFVKEIEKNFGPESDFIKNLEEAIRKNVPGGSKIEVKKPQVRIEMRAKAVADKAKVEADQAKAVGAKLKAEAQAKAQVRARVGAASERRDRRIESLESRIDALKAELDRLKAEDKLDDEDEQDGDAQRSPSANSIRR